MKIVFSDLDGTILDFNTYSYDDALEGINLLRDNGAPLIPVSSKTFIEMKSLHRELKLTYPFIFENGGGIAFPEDSGNGEDYRIELFGVGTDILKEKLNILRDIVGTPIKALFEMDIDEVVERTNLSQKSAELVKKRITSIPFVPVESECKIDLDDTNVRLKEYDIVITKGGRFYHFSSIGANKGNAVKKVIDYIRDVYNVDTIVSIGIGDSENDIPMLKAVDIPYLVRKHDDTIIETDMRVTTTKGIGPRGFTEAMKLVFSE